MKHKLIGYIDQFKKARIMVIGDLMVDEYIWGKVARISPEAPVPVVNVTSENLRLGGAGNVVHNIHDLGAKVFVGGTVGNDEMGRRLIMDLSEMGLNTQGIIVDPGRPTTVKTRIIAHHQQVVRFDREVTGPIPDSVREKILERVEERIDELDAILISDYAKGVVTQPLMDRVRSLAQAKGKILAVDPKVKNFPLFREVTIITPNHQEAAEGAGRIVQSEEDLLEVGKILLERLKVQSVLITRGEKGMSLFQRSGEITHIPTMAKEVYDVTGAGDTAIAVLTLAMAVGASPKEAAILSNYAAGIVVQELGTATVKPWELEDAVRNGIRSKVRKPLSRG